MRTLVFITFFALCSAAVAQQGGTTDTRRVGQPTQSTNDKPAPSDPRVHKPSNINPFAKPGTATPSPTPARKP